MMKHQEGRGSSTPITAEKTKTKRSRRDILVFVGGLLVGHVLSVTIYRFVYYENTSNKNDINFIKHSFLNGQQRGRPESSHSKTSIAKTNKLIEGETSFSDGWHPVYVYHGGIGSSSTNKDNIEKEGGGGSSEKRTTSMVIDKIPHNSLTFRENFKEYGSQAKQDEMVIMLMDRFTSHQKSFYENKGLPVPPQYNKYFFVDLASNDAIQLSNTLRLERLRLLDSDDVTTNKNIQGLITSAKTRQHWDGLCIEPNPKYWYRLAHRECTVVGTFVGTDVDGTIMNVTNMDLEVYGGIVGAEMDNKAGQRSQWAQEVDVSQTEERAVVSLQTVMDKFHVPAPYIDYLSLDVEGAEYLVMKHFPFDKYKFRIMTVERPKDELVKLLKQKGYVYVMKIVNWGETLWVHESFLKRSNNKKRNEKTNEEGNDATDETCGMTLKEIQTLITKVAGRQVRHMLNWKGTYGEEPW